jgi:hypothetical protein
VHVVYVASKPVFEQGMRKVQHLHPNVAFRKQTRLSTDLKEIVAQHQENLILFVVDDMVFFRDLELNKVEQLLEKDNTILCFQSRLSKNIKKSFTREESCVVPLLLPSSFPSIRTFFPFLGDSEWNYPFDLTGGLYRGADLIEILSLVEERFGLEMLDHPNLLELYGNKVLSEDIGFPNSESHLIACPSEPVCTVVTVNRVQEVFANKIYAHLDVDWLARRFLEEENNEDFAVDLEWYRNQDFDCVHTKTLKLLGIAPWES